MGRFVAVVLLFVGSCVSPNDVSCGALTCPGGTTCVQLTDPDQPLCATAEQVKSCDGKADGDACSLSTSVSSVCRNGACVAIECGNGHLDPGEVCDDHDTVTGNGCAADCLSDETCGNGVVDPLVLVGMEKQPNELCDDGNLTSGDGCSSACKPERDTWTRVDQKIEPLYRHAMSYDTDRRRVVLFGGFFQDAQYDDQTQTEVFEWTGAAWAHVPVTLAPAPRTEHAMAYDPVRHRTVLFGGTIGQTGGELADTWEWDGARWERKHPAVSPPARAAARMVYDGTRKQIVLFGGSFEGIGFDDTWTWDGTTWTEVAATTRPGARYDHVMAFDPERGVIVVSGGRSTAATLDTWELQGTTWRQVASAPTPDQLFRRASAAYDPVGHRVIAYAGQAFSTSAASTGTFAYDGTQWTDLADASPGDRSWATLATDWKTGTVLMFGGDSSSGLVDTTWQWNGSAWSLVTPFDMPGRSLMASARDPERGVVWLFGGADASLTDTSTLVSFDGAAFTSYAAVGPSARSLAGLAYDRKRSKLVMFGGATTPLPGTPTLAPAETWLFDGTSWSNPTTSTIPAARVGAAMVYDPRRDRVVMFGGRASGNTLLDETWEWNGSDWNKITISGPSARWLTTMEYDEARGKVVLVGGLTGNVVDNDMWSYDGTAWTKLFDKNALPPRLLTALAYDPGTSGIVLFSGLPVNSVVGLPDTWRWDGTTWGELAIAPSPPSRSSGSLFTSPDGTGVFAFGGIKNYDDVGAPTYSEVWRLRLENDGAREICDLAIDNDGDGKLGCNDLDCWTRCTPECPPGTTCNASAPHCGDSICNASLETARNCPSDCPPVPRCGDGFCDAPETVATCPGDCTP